jgi:hypothetical protein
MSSTTTPSCKSTLRWTNKGEPKSQNSKKDIRIKTAANKLDSKPPQEQGPNLQGGFRIDANYPVKPKSGDLDKQPLRPINKLPTTQTEEVTPHQYKQEITFQNHSPAVYNGQLSNGSRGDFRVAKASLETNFLHYHNESTSTMNNLMPYEIVETSDNDDDEDDFEITDERGSNQTYDSKRPLLYQTLEMRRMQAESNKNI